MVPIKTSVEDIEKILNYLAKQIGFTAITKVESTLGSLDGRKLGAMVEFGLVTRDGANIKITDRGSKFASGDQAGALKETVGGVALYHATLEWVHYGSRSEVTATEIGQYWETKHSATIGGVKGDTLKNGAVCFGRIVQGAGLGALTIGRGGNETRIAFDLSVVDSVLHSTSAAAAVPEGEEPTAPPVSAPPSGSEAAAPAAEAVPQIRDVAVSASPSVHVNVEIHIAADARADTVREIFKNMARYVLNKPVNDDDD
ncbi:hypothetical protein EDL96_02160 [Kocuria soli]|uniref:Uncharacterized protein n=1 Tax=Kocuria soli TaxID=2485125 RepID=A0A3N3ZSV4_9MICC|nr:hypothetical protein [Kocuria soli]ROZ64672.1 hypothetical protein EDL96_02160 [Kocuria soli]